MKRVFLLAAALMLLGVGYASAQTTSLPTARWQTQELNFRTLSGGANLDTAYATGSATRADTTVAFPWFQNVWFPQTGLIASDSLIVAMMAFEVDPAATSGISVTADTIYATIQVSDDQTNWLGTTPVTPANGQTTYNATGTNRVGQPILKSGGSAGSFFYPIRQKYTALVCPSYALEGTAPGVSSLWGWRYIRFIIGNALVGKYRLAISYWKVY